MAELFLSDRLQPSLLDRLTDLEPGSKLESRDSRVMSWSRLRDSVLRDLGWLMNTVHLQATQDLSWVPEAQSSVINYGLPDLAGSHLISHDVGELERELVKAILAFEPRILADSLVVKAQIDEQRMNRSALIFSSPGQSSCLSIWQDGLSWMMRRMTPGVICTVRVNG